VTERSDSGGMSFLDDEEYEKGGIEMNAAARAALMQKLSQTHSAGIQHYLQITRDLTIIGRQRDDDGQNKLLQINGSKASYIINRMN
jgi:hypothetical protein